MRKPIHLKSDNFYGNFLTRKEKSGLITIPESILEAIVGSELIAMPKSGFMGISLISPSRFKHIQLELNRRFSEKVKEERKILRTFYRGIENVELANNKIRISNWLWRTLKLEDDNFIIAGNYEKIDILNPKRFNEIAFQKDRSSDQTIVQNQLSNKTEIRKNIVVVNNALLKVVQTYPNFLHSMNPWQFEEFMAELFEKQGYTVELTKKTRDGGIDILAYKKNTFNDELLAIECKKHSLYNKVSRPIIQNLHSNVEFGSLTGGVLATTSYFTKDAKSFADKLKYRLNLIDLNNLHLILNDLDSH